MIRFLLFVLLLLSLGFLQAQNSSGVTTYSPFSSGKSKPSEPPEKELGKQVVKCHAFLLTRGAFVLGFERALNDAFSLEAQLGITYRDYLFENLHDGVGFGSDFDEDVQSFGGPFMGLMGKFYFNRDFPEGGYIGSLVRNRIYNMKVKSGSTGDDLIKTNYQMTEFGVFIGYQYSGYYTEAVYDFYIGPAISWAHYDSYDLDDNNVYVKSRAKLQYPVMIFGFNIGLPF